VAADPADRVPASQRRATGMRELTLRVASALVLAPLAVGVAYVGGWPFVLFWGAAAIGVWWEWSRLVAGENVTGAFAIGMAGLVLAAALAGFGLFAAAVAAIGLTAIVVAVVAASERRLWTAVGVGYAGSILVAPVALRHDPDYGFVAIVFLFSVVWVTDVMAYVVGRLVGGPKLAPRVSPNKTWSGAVGGALGAIVAGVATARAAGLDNWMMISLVVLGLSICSQAGDIFESRLKRRHGAKDASQLIPGHGGLMDRLDGFVAAAFAAALLGALRAGGAPARGLLVW
jgi:phosphatidate cytidylyltransferase